ncbi:hypothetical protein [Mesorhizobium sp.]|uniref:hypothetical protein n=1 Tax=Mesorhizobium sp. TaxID=1871066 RepID=UPI000FEA3B8E|nr:hypothetical protein [Mesorhizobium sp.]RWP58001.1 MAG: hypothetical protein EOR08_28760 [Mesorhizobium sp.]
MLTVRTGYRQRHEPANFGVDPRSSAGSTPTTLAPLLADVHDMLAGVVIEQLDWSVFIDRHADRRRCSTSSPPFFGSESDYGKELFGRDQFEASAD